MSTLTNQYLTDVTITPLEQPRLFGDIYVSFFRVDDPGISLSGFPGNFDNDLFYCANPASGVEFLALGSIFSLVADDYYSLNRVARSVLTNEPGELPCPLPDWFSYISFPFESSPDIPYARFVMPEYLIKQESREFTLRVNTHKDAFIGNDNIVLDVKKLIDRLRNADRKIHSVSNIEILDDPRDIFYGGVEKIKSAISSGVISKGVLSRDRVIRFTGSFSFPYALEELQRNYPDCTTIFTNYPGRNFIAATPERLFRLEGKTVITEALAGSIRTETDADDQMIMEEQLLISEKDYEEHVIVRDYLTARLAKVADKLIYPEKPLLKQLSNVTHLRTPIDATLKEGVTAIDLGKLLFPTPALCGEPMETAAKLINSIEQRKRDLYGGVTGFISNHGVSEFYVSIRCGFIDDERATLYAGCGIVAGSDPQSEYEETNLKFIPLTSLFTDENKP